LVFRKCCKKRPIFFEVLLRMLLLRHTASMLFLIINATMAVPTIPDRIIPIPPTKISPYKLSAAMSSGKVAVPTKLSAVAVGAHRLDSLPLTVETREARLLQRAVRRFCLLTGNFPTVATKAGPSIIFLQLLQTSRFAIIQNA